MFNISSPLASECNILLMILPERVFGKSGINIIASHRAISPISALITAFISYYQTEFGRTIFSGLQTYLFPIILVY